MPKWLDTAATAWVEAEIRARDRARIAALKADPRGWRRWWLLFLLVGPGILVMVADNDAGGVITYAQTGAGYGLGFYLPFLVLLGPVAYIVQEMTVRLGAVTRRGHAEMIWGRYGPFWGAFSLIDLVVANFLTLVTEFIGITLGMQVLGVPPVASALAAVALIAAVLLGLRYYTWERVSLGIAAGNLVFIPLALMAKPHWGAVGAAFLHWQVRGGFTPAFLYVLLANLGTTIAPWMLFFQQSSVVDKGLTEREIRHGQVDTAIGAAVMVAVALAIVILTGSWLYGQPGSGQWDMQRILVALGAHLGRWGEDLFALGLVEAGTIAAIAISASTSWACGEAFGWPKSINLPPKVAWRFYLPGLISLVAAALVVLVPGMPLGFLNLTVQVIATIFMPAAMLFLLLLLNDPEVMGEHVNRRWQNWAAGGIVLFLVAMNGLYGLSVVFPHAFAHWL
ncbi:MAG: divalent metal cation transporter [Firmicutes bacterium]|nr:divalent metal cation transporter [Alicyclobacillaceae bacterium]MCL6498087.1 divalent metal cation transporter [Bacillota bacterium]